MELNLNLAPRGQSKPQVLAVRELGVADLLPAPKGSTPKPIKELRDSHREIARLLAKGMKAVEVSAITGYSQSRISILQGDPAFKELLAHYREVSDAAFANLAERTKALTLDALTELHERVVESPGSIGTGTLLDIVKTGLDRSGVGPQSTTRNLHVHTDPSTIAELLAAAGEQGKVYEATYEQGQSGSGTGGAGGQGAGTSLIALSASTRAEERMGIGAAPAHPSGQEAAGEQGKGEGV